MKGHLPYTLKGSPSAFVGLTGFFWHHFLLAWQKQYPQGMQSLPLSCQWSGRIVRRKLLAFRHRSLRSSAPFP